MFATNDRSISLLDKPLKIKSDQFSTLSTMRWLECTRIRPISLEIETIGSVKDKPFQMSKMLAAFRAFAPITGLIVILLFMDATERVFPVTARTNVENIRRVCGICDRVAHKPIAAFGLHKRTLLSTETAIST
jgi:hypothetical protein